ncbi:MAG: CPBP family intramembrane metalloprotease [Clostridiales bacterium]|nr:CPBP family intramembrane metalloprotease [Candidatus Blautia equi]
MKRFIGMLFVSLTAVLFMFAQSLILRDPALYYPVAQSISELLHIYDTDMVMIVWQWVTYTVTLAPIIWVFYYSVLMVRKKGGFGPQLMFISIGALLLCTLISMLTNAQFYTGLFSKIVYWQVIPEKTRIPIVAITAFFSLLCLFLIYVNLYLPNIKANENTYFQTENLVKATTRYAGVWICAHGALLFVASLKSFLYAYNVVSLKDFILAIVPFSRSWLGVALVLLMEPLVHEIAFRGLIFEHLKKSVKPILAGIISSVLYAIWFDMLLGHGGLLIYAFFLGVLYCAIYHGTHRLRFAMLAHSYLNFLILFILGNMDKSILPVIPKLCQADKMLVKAAESNSPIMLLFSLVVMIGGVIIAKLFPVP